MRGIRMGCACALWSVALVWSQLSYAVTITFYYPIAVGGPITAIVDGMVADFERAHPDVKVRPVYSGNYGDTLTKALTGNRSGNPPNVAVLTASEVYTLIDEDAVLPIDQFVKNDADRAWLAGFYPAFLMNGRYKGKTYGIPFQRSTQLLYWNKAAFKSAGLDPDRPPGTWDDLVAFSKRLTLRDPTGKVTQWGLMIPSGGTSHWLLQGLTTPNGAKLMNDDGTATYFTDEGVVEALQFWVDLSRKYKVMPEGLIDTATQRKDFVDGRTAMMYVTSGNLTSIQANAKFDFGVAPLPARKRAGSPTGGGSMFIFKKSSAEEAAAAFSFVRWMTSAEQAAKWSIATGYVAPRADAWSLPVMQKYVKDFPLALVAKGQLDSSVAEFSTHDGARTTRALENAIEAAITGTKSPAQALRDAQAEAARLLRPYQ